MFALVLALNVGLDMSLLVCSLDADCNRLKCGPGCHCEIRDIQRKRGICRCAAGWTGLWCESEVMPTPMPTGMPTPMPSSAPSPAPTPLGVVAPWGRWSACTRTCGGGTQARSRHCLPRYVAERHPACAAGTGPRSPVRKLPTRAPGAAPYATIRGLWQQERVCAMVPCVGEGPSRFCGGVGAPGSMHWVPESNWRAMGTTGLLARIDTSHCGFSRRSSAGVWYVMDLTTSTGRVSEQLVLLRGRGTIMRPTATSFEVELTHPILRGAALLRAARIGRWLVSWVGDTGANCGSTVALHSGWKSVRVGGIKGATLGKRKYMRNALQLRVNTGLVSASPLDDEHNKKNAGLLYFVSLTGQRNVRHVHGSHAVWIMGAGQFCVYLFAPSVPNGSSQGTTAAELTPYRAERDGWTVSWLAIGRSTRWGGETPATAWHEQTGRNTGCSVHIDATHAKFEGHPSFVWTLSAAGAIQALWAAAGFGILTAYSRAGFTISIGWGKRHQQKTPWLDGNWRVQWLGFEQRDCPSSSWSSWGRCNCGRMVKTTRRTVGVVERYRHLSRDGAPLQANNVRQPLPHGGDRWRSAMLCHQPLLLQHRQCTCSNVTKITTVAKQSEMHMVTNTASRAAMQNKAAARDSTAAASWAAAQLHLAGSFQLPVRCVRRYPSVANARKGAAPHIHDHVALAVGMYFQPDMTTSTTTTTSAAPVWEPANVSFAVQRWLASQLAGAVGLQPIEVALRVSQKANGNQSGQAACARHAGQAALVTINVSFVTRTQATSRALIRMLNSSSFSHFFACRVRSAASVRADVAAVVSHGKCDTLARITFHAMRIVQNISKARVAFHIVKSGQTRGHLKRSARMHLGDVKVILRRFIALFLLTPVMLPVIVVILCITLYSWRICRLGKHQRTFAVEQTENSVCTTSRHGHRENVALLEAAAHTNHHTVDLPTEIEPASVLSDDTAMWRQIVREQIYKSSEE